MFVCPLCVLLGRDVLCSGGEQEADFAHVSRVFGRMLSARRYVDVVATDIAAGLILLRHVQKAEVRWGLRARARVCVCVVLFITSRAKPAGQRKCDTRRG